MPYTGDRDQEEGAQMTRRQFLKAAGLTGLGLVAVRTFGIRPPAALAGGEGEREARPSTVNMLCWEGYDFPDQFADLKAERNFEISGTYIGNNDEIFTNI